MCLVRHSIAKLGLLQDSQHGPCAGYDSHSRPYVGVGKKMVILDIILDIGRRSWTYDSHHGGPLYWAYGDHNGPHLGHRNGHPGVCIGYIMGLILNIR